MSPSNFPQGKLSLDIQTWNPSWGEKKPFSSLSSSPTGTLLSGRSLQGTHHIQAPSWWSRGAVRNGRVPRAPPSPLTRRLQAENQFPSVCPDIPSAPRLFTAEQCCAFTIELRGAETHREGTTLVLFPSVQPVTTAISWRAHFSNPHLFGNPDYHYFITKRHRLKEV